MACDFLDDDFLTFSTLKQHASGLDTGGASVTPTSTGNMLSASFESTFFGLPLEPLADFTYDGAGLDDDFLEDLMDQLEDESTADKFLSDSIFGDFDLMTEEALADVDDFEMVLSDNEGSNFCSSDSGKGNGCMMEMDDVENSKVRSGKGPNGAPGSPSKRSNCSNSSCKKVGLMKSTSNNSLLSRMSESNVPKVMVNSRSSNKQNCSVNKKVSKVKRKKAGVSLLAKPSKQVKSLLDTSRSSNRIVPVAAVPSSNSPILLKTSKGDFRISKIVVGNNDLENSKNSNACKLVNGMIVKRITPSSQCVTMKTQYVTTKSNNQSIQMQKCASSSSSCLWPSSISSSNPSTSTSKPMFQDHDYCPPNVSRSSLIVIDN